jgi:hypothetical protein
VRSRGRRSFVLWSAPAVDALPPSQPPGASAPYEYAATDWRPHDAREVELCARAEHTDWLYMGLSLAAFSGAAYVDANRIKFVGYDPDDGRPPVSNFGPAVRLTGPALVGLTWGFFVGGGYLAQPKCSQDWVASAPREGDVHSSVPLALALGLLSGATAPMLEFFFVGPIPQQWPIYERTLRLATAAATGFGGAILPYLLPPKTWRAAKALERVRAGVDGTGGLVSYAVRF